MELKFDLAAESVMRELIGGAVLTQAIYAISKLGVPDALALAPRSASELAATVGANADALRRVMRYLVSRGIFVENADARFALTPASEFLQTAHPRSLRPSAIRSGEGLWQTSTGLLQALRTGETAHEAVHGETFFDGARSGFSLRMNSSLSGLADAVADLHEVVQAKTIVDVGGGNGALLTAILDRLPHLRGILLERAEVIDETWITNDRCQPVAGDFFQTVPHADVAILSWILHDWNDDDARRLLRSCRTSGCDTLIILEALLPERAERVTPQPGVIADPFTLDMQMLLLTGGRERTLSEYRSLLEEEGFLLKKTMPLSSARGASLLIARSA